MAIVKHERTQENYKYISQLPTLCDIVYYDYRMCLILCENK